MKFNEKILNSEFDWNWKLQHRLQRNMERWPVPLRNQNLKVTSQHRPAGSTIAQKIQAPQHNFYNWLRANHLRVSFDPIVPRHQYAWSLRSPTSWSQIGASEMHLVPGGFGFGLCALAAHYPPGYQTGEHPYWQEGSHCKDHRFWSGCRWKRGFYRLHCHSLVPGTLKFARDKGVLLRYWRVFTGVRDCWAIFGQSSFSRSQ